jgi:hypothetical protein
MGRPSIQKKYSGESDSLADAAGQLLRYGREKYSPKVTSEPMQTAQI